MIGMSTARTTLLVFLLLACCAAANLYVDRSLGDDAHDGQAALPGADGSGPLRTIAAAIDRATPGDIIYLAPHASPYRETVHIRDRSGEPHRPIVLDGLGATVSGADPLDPEDWTALGGGLYRSTLLPERIRWDEAVEVRFFLIFNDRPQRMERTSKGPQAPFKKPAELQPGEWTYAAAERALYLRIGPEEDLATAGIEVPVRRNGVSVHGNSSHWIIRNLTCRRAINDGFSISPFGGQIRDLRFENIRALDCGDDGISAHGDSEFSVDGFEAAGNSTGICDTGNSRTSYNRAFIHGNYGMDVAFILERGMTAPAWHAISNSVIIASAATVPFLAVSETDGPHHCTVELDHVLIAGPPEGSVIQIGRRAVLRARNVTWLDLDLAAHGTSLSLTGSEVMAREGCRLVIGEETRWQASGNRYQAAWVRIGGERFPPCRIEDYRERTGDNSRWMPVGRTTEKTPRKGADLVRLRPFDPFLSAQQAAVWKAYATRPSARPSSAEDVVQLLHQSFDDEEIFPFGLRGRAGSRIHSGGRWSPFAEGGPAIVPGGATRRGALRLVRGRPPVMAETRIGARWSGPYRFTCRVLREQGAGLAVALGDAFGLDDAGLLIDGEGQVFLRHYAGSPAWTPTGQTVPAGKWMAVILEAGDGFFTGGVEGLPETTLRQPRNGAGFAPAVIRFAPQGAEGTALLIGEVRLEALNSPAIAPL